MDKPAAVRPSLAETLYEQQHINDNRVATLIASDVTCFILAFIAVFLRLLSRRIGKIKYMADDWLIINALIFTAATLTCELLVTRWGWARHSILSTNAHALRKTVIAAEFLYSFAIFSVKASVLYLYYRVFFVSQSFARALWALAIFNFAFSGVLAFASLLQCFPLRHIWDTSVGGYCLKVSIASTIFGIINSITDLIILIMPIPILWKLRMETKEKLQIMGIFLLGGFVLICSLVRAVIIHEQRWTDPDWDDVTMGIWTLAEISIGIVSACLPTMRPLFSKGIARLRVPPVEQDLRAPETREDSNSTLDVTLQRTPSLPALSQKFAHLGVLGNLPPA